MSGDAKETQFEYFKDVDDDDMTIMITFRIAGIKGKLNILM